MLVKQSVAGQLDLQRAPFAAQEIPAHHANGFAAAVHGRHDVVDNVAARLKVPVVQAELQRGSVSFQVGQQLVHHPQLVGGVVGNEGIVGAVFLLLPEPAPLFAEPGAEDVVAVLDFPVELDVKQRPDGEEEDQRRRAEEQVLAEVDEANAGVKVIEFLCGIVRTGEAEEVDHLDVGVDCPVLQQAVVAGAAQRDAANVKVLEFGKTLQHADRKGLDNVVIQLDFL